MVLRADTNLEDLAVETVLISNTEKKLGKTWSIRKLGDKLKWPDILVIEISKKEVGGNDWKLNSWNNF